MDNKVNNNMAKRVKQKDIKPIVHPMENSSKFKTHDDWIHSYDSYVALLSHKRPSYHWYTHEFAEVFIEPIMGTPDLHGNYVHIIYERNGNHPVNSFMSHYDTVHYDAGFQCFNFDSIRNEIFLSEKSLFSADSSNCLGADCTTGIWLMLNMIANNVPGVYVIHSNEEVGGVGATALVDDYISSYLEDGSHWIDHVKTAISFDRFGTDSIITYQYGIRTASSKFARSLSRVLSLGDGHVFKEDVTGVYTDSAEYAGVIPECTNISVGYYDQHSVSEYQSVDFMMNLRNKLISRDTKWEEIVIHRKMTSSNLVSNGYSSSLFEGFNDDYRDQDDWGKNEDEVTKINITKDELDLVELIEGNEVLIANILAENEYYADELNHDIDLLYRRVDYSYG